MLGAARGSAVRSLALFDYGGRVLAGSDDGTLRTQDLFSGVQVVPTRRHAGPVTSVMTSQDTAITGSTDGTLRLWTLPDLAEGPVLQTGPVLCAAADSNGMIAIIGDHNGNFKVWDLRTRARIVTLGGHSGPIRALALTQEDALAVTAGEDGNVRVWYLRGAFGPASGPVLATGHGPLTSIAVTPGASQAVTGGRDGAVRVWDLQAEREIAHFQGDSAIINCVLLDTRPIVLAVAQEDGRPYRLELRT